MSDGDPWSRYWRSGGDARRGCLPVADGPVAQAQMRVWLAFASALAKGASLLDIGTGSGSVLRWVRAARQDLELTGIDAAAQLPPAAAGITLKAGVAMERLPFRNASFDAAASQFGFEYGDTQAASAELARVLKAGSRLLMMIHHRDGPIVGHNGGRREALLWALGAPLETARAFARACPGTILPLPVAVTDAPATAQRLHPEQSAGVELATGIVQRLRAARTGAEALSMLDRLAAEARGEVARIGALCRAARDDAAIAALREQLVQAGFSMEPAGTLSDGRAPRPLAWLLSGRR